MKPRLLVALCTYAFLALCAGLTLTGYFRLTVWIVLAAFAIKTWVSARMQDLK